MHLPPKKKKKKKILNQMIKKDKEIKEPTI